MEIIIFLGSHQYFYKKGSTEYRLDPVTYLQRICIRLPHPLSFTKLHTTQKG